MPRSLVKAIAAAHLALFVAGFPAKGEPAGTQPLQRIAFGSCNKTWRENLLWKPLVDLHPDLWVWLGDIVYARDYDIPDLTAKYQALERNPGYEALRKTCPIIGTWDDHDYAGGEVGGQYAFRKQSQALLLDFLREPADSPRRKQEGVYWSYDFGPRGKRVRIVLMDTRYFRPAEGRNADLLGPAQWKWLEDRLTSDPPEVLLLGSSVQLIPDQHPYDKWSDYPESRQRLLGLLDRCAAKRVIVLSGDRHMAEISRLETSAPCRAIYEVTSSGMTHTCYSSAKNLYFDFEREPNRARVAGPFIGFNFGLVRIDWSKPVPGVELDAVDPSGEPKLKVKL